MMFRTMRLLAPEGVAAPVIADPVVPVAPVVPAVVTTADLPPEALSKRLEQAKHSAQTELLASWGVTDPAQVKSYIDAAKAAEEAKKTNETRLAEQGVKLSASEEGLTAAVDIFSASIKPEQKAAVDAIAGNDKTLWLKTYRAMAPTWGVAAPVVTSAPIAAPPVAPVAPTSTAPTAPAPSPTSVTTSPTDHVAVYASLKSTNPFVASAYLQQHGDACYPKT
jgi:hypothetical protein